MTIDLKMGEEMVSEGMKGHMKNLDMILEKGVQALDPSTPHSSRLSSPSRYNEKESASQTFLKPKVGDPKD